MGWKSWEVKGQSQLLEGEKEGRRSQREHSNQKGKTLYVNRKKERIRKLCKKQNLSQQSSQTLTTQ